MNFYQFTVNVAFWPTLRLEKASVKVTEKGILVRKVQRLGEKNTQNRSLTFCQEIDFALAGNGAALSDSSCHCGRKRIGHHQGCAAGIPKSLLPV